MSRGFAFIPLSLILLALTGGSSSAREEDEVFTPEDYREVAGILSWLIEVPDDLAESQFLSTSWRIPSIGEKPSQVRASGMDFRDVPGGEMVKVFVWTQSGVAAQGEGFSGMKFCLKFRGKNHRMQKRFGTLELPDGYVDLYGHLAESNQPYDDGGWLLMMSNPNGDKGATLCTLNLDYEDR